MKVLAISGSLRTESYNTALARAAVELAPEGVFVDLYDGLALLPPYDQDLDEGSSDRRLRRSTSASASKQRTQS